MIKIANVYNMGNTFMPQMVLYVDKLMSSYGTGFGVIGLPDNDLKKYFLWILDNFSIGLYPAYGLYVKEQYIDYYRVSDNIWLNMWRLGWYATPVGLSGKISLLPYLGSCPFYKLSILDQMHEVMSKSNITDVNVLSCVESRLLELKIDIILTLTKDDLSKIRDLVCNLKGDPMLNTIPIRKRRRFLSRIRGVCPIVL